MSYSGDAKSDAIETVKEYRDEIIEMLCGSGEASDDLLNDYGTGDSWHRESHVDREYDLQEAADLLQELREFEETDSGLWDGLEPVRAISAQAAFTYGNAVYSEWAGLIEEINSRWDDVSAHLENLESGWSGVCEEFDSMQEKYPAIDPEAIKKSVAEKVIDEICE